MEWVAADFVNILLPSDCRVCGGAMVALSRVRICEACVARVGALTDAGEDVYCTRCGDAMGMESARFAAAMGVSECTMCRLAPPQFDRAVSFSSYEDEMRSMLHLLKFEGMRDIAEHVLGEAMAQTALRLREDSATELVVVAVPLYVARERRRGYNQAKLLAEALVKRLRQAAPGWTLRLRCDVLERAKDTHALYGLNPTQRRSSLRGAFRVADMEVVRGHEVLLVDDIMTTGATARECARVLKRAGATKVWVVTAARALPESVHGAVLQQPKGVANPAAADTAMWDATPARVIEPGVGKQAGFL